MNNQKEGDVTVSKEKLRELMFSIDFTLCSYDITRNDVKKIQRKFEDLVKNIDLFDKGSNNE